ncbi:MAG: hypothetical protein Q9159_002695 [Coniocarpon cinnabarinum]
MSTPQQSNDPKTGSGSGDATQKHTPGKGPSSLGIPAITRRGTNEKSLNTSDTDTTTKKEEPSHLFRKGLEMVGLGGGNKGREQP